LKNENTNRIRKPSTFGEIHVYPQLLRRYRWATDEPGIRRVFLRDEHDLTHALSALHAALRLAVSTTAAAPISSGRSAEAGIDGMKDIAAFLHVRQAGVLLVIRGILSASMMRSHVCVPDAAAAQRPAAPRARYRCVALLPGWC
jgi:hypothetical protein